VSSGAPLIRDEGESTPSRAEASQNDVEHEEEPMRFAMLINGTDDDWDDANAQAAATGDEDPMAKIWEFMERWEKAGKIVPGGVELDSPRKAKTIRAGDDGGRVVTDGPYLELKEVIGGVVFLDAADMDEAVSIAATWPIWGSSSVEVRPVIEH
jgi:hypothetical protein